MHIGAKFPYEETSLSIYSRVSDEKLSEKCNTLQPLDNPKITLSRKGIRTITKVVKIM